MWQRKQGKLGVFSGLYMESDYPIWIIGKVCVRAKWPIRPELIPVSVAWSDWEYFNSPLDGMLVHRRVTPSIKFTGTHLYTWVERGTVRVKFLTQEHNTVSPARAQTRTARSRVERTKQEATGPPNLENFQKIQGGTEPHVQNFLTNLPKVASILLIKIL